MGRGDFAKFPGREIEGDGGAVPVGANFRYELPARQARSLAPWYLQRVASLVLDLDLDAAALARGLDDGAAAVLMAHLGSHALLAGGVRLEAIAVLLQPEGGVDIAAEA